MNGPETSGEQCLRGDGENAQPDDDFRFSPRPNRANEIQWRAWGDEAFREARELGRPVLLSLSAVWCHWCHVMDETSYSDPQVIRLINSRYVPVRVDSDRRPDVNRRYNMGGWPTTAFLTHAGEVLTGATYLPAGHLLDALQRVHVFYAEHRKELDESGAAEATKALDGDAHKTRTVARSMMQDQGETRQRLEALEWVQRQCLQAFDPLFGGFGTQPKFPQAEVLRLLLLRASSCVDERVDKALHKTLHAMAEGAIYDRVEDGFFRYATRRDWSEPHYEKMLQDNAGLLRVYAEAYGLLGDAAYAEVARGVARYLTTTLWQPLVRAFAGSQDADERYYALDAEGRGASQAPFVDPTVYVDWNALAAGSLLRAAQLLHEPALAEPALAALDTLWDGARKRRGMAHYLSPAARPAGNGSAVGLRPAGVSGLLGDQALVAAAMLDAYEHTGESAYLARAALLLDWVDEHLSLPGGGLADRLPEPGGGLLRPIAADLGEAAVFADSLLRFTAYGGEQRYHERAQRLLAALQPEYRRYGLAAAPFAMTLQRTQDPPVHVAVVGAADLPQSHALLAAALSLPQPQRTAQLLDPGRDRERIVRDGYAALETPVAYICLGRTCMAPVSDPCELTRLVKGRSPTAADEAAGAAEPPGLKDDR